MKIMFFQTTMCTVFLSAGCPQVAHNLTRKQDVHKHKSRVKFQGNKQMISWYSVSPKIQA